MVKIGLIESSAFDILNYPSILHGKFSTIVRNGVEYKHLFAFKHYIEDYPFSLSFDTVDAFDKWMVEYEWRYFLIPLDLVPSISHYADFVKETFPELIFDVILDKQVISVEGVNVEVPVNQVKMIPCNCTRWTEEGLTLLDAVIENWNTTYPTKIIDFQVKFESYEEFKAFRDGHVQVL